MHSPILAYLQQLYRKHHALKEGTVATYIPELGKANPEDFGICLATADGQVYQVGNTTQTFTIQSISKPFTYGIALEDQGKKEVLKKIWMEPSGEAFNSISLDPTGRPVNPMINAGAIATTGQVQGKTSLQKVRRILDTFSRYAGRPLKVDQAIYKSESETGHRNRAIAHMLRNFDIFTEDPSPSLDAYFQQCSILVNCRDLAVMGATLANSGLNPITKQRAVINEYVENILSVMATCGMYDAAGEWLYNVGMPAKSGVAGGVLTVLPGQLAVAVYSPRLDARGNSARGIAVCRDLSTHFGLHLFNVPNPGAYVIRHRTNSTLTSSHRLRPASEVSCLKTHGERIQLFDLQGELSFSSTERVVRDLMDSASTTFSILLNFGRVHQIDIVSVLLLLETFQTLSKNKIRVYVTHSHHLPLLERAARKEYGEKVPKLLFWEEDEDLALEACENHLIERLSKRRRSNIAVPLAQSDLSEGLTPEEQKQLKSLLRTVHYAKNQVVLKAGDPGAELLIITRGKVSVWMTNDKGRKKRLTTRTPGRIIGEISLLNRAPRTANVTADTEVEALCLPIEGFDALAITEPRLYAKIITNIARQISDRLNDSNTQFLRAQA